MKNARIILALLIVTLLSGSVFADVPSVYGGDGNYKKADTSRLIIPGAGVNWVRLGMQISYVKKSYGEPDEVQAFNNHKGYLYKKHGLKFVTNPIGKIIGIEVFNSKYATKKGFTVGSNKRFAYQMLGRNYRQTAATMNEGPQGTNAATYKAWAYPGLIVVWNEPYTKAMANQDMNQSSNAATYNSNLKRIRELDQLIAKLDQNIDNVQNLILKYPNHPKTSIATASLNNMISQRNQVTRERNSLVKQNNSLAGQYKKASNSGKLNPAAKYIVITRK